MRRIAQYAVLLSLLLASVGVVHAEPPMLGARDNPVPLGKPILLTAGDVKEYVAIAEVDRGAFAWQRIQRYSAANGPAAPGKEYLMALVVVRYISGAKDQASLNFQLLSNNEVSSRAPNIVHLNPDFQINFTPDVMGGGWIVREVDPDDPNPLLSVTMGNSRDNAFYFTATDPQSGPDTQSVPDNGVDMGPRPVANIY